MDAPAPYPDSPMGDAFAAVDASSLVPGAWVTIPKGTFSMGSPSSDPCKGSDEDQHPVTLTREFLMQITEVSQGQFASLMGYNPSRFGPHGSGPDCGLDCPVERVNWHEAAAYCNALSLKAGRARCYTCTGAGANVICQDAPSYSGQQIYACPGYRLPTDAEWEHACRAGTTTPYYNGINDPSSCSNCSKKDANAGAIAWYCANAGSSTHPAKGKQPNKWGLFDMPGNVWEWCHDWYMSSLGSGAATDPVGPPTGSRRVLRSGSWNSTTNDMRAANRGRNQPDYRGNIGFRCSRSSP